MRSGTPSQRLRAKVALAAPALTHSSERIWCSPNVRQLYPCYLVTMHGVVRAAASLLRSAAGRARELASRDAVAAGLVDYYARHAIEEAGHDQWLLEDLVAIGADPEAAQQFPQASIANLVGAQYYWLRHAHPVALLGHMAVVEGNSPKEGFAERLEAITGYPPEGFRTIRRHARIDISHARELYRTIDSLPLLAQHETLLGVSALHTIGAAVTVFDEILTSVTSYEVESR